jgi:carboxymethylenebutenolidase
MFAVNIYRGDRMSGSNIAIKTAAGSGYSGYLSMPENPNGSGIIVIQEIFGVNSHIRDITDLYAAAGYVALAPDVFWRQQPHVELGYTPEDIQKGASLAKQLDPAQVIADLHDAAAMVKGVPQFSKKLGVVGYCLGGGLAYDMATHDLVDVAVGYYGGAIEHHLDQAKNLHCPLMLHFGDKDAHIPMPSVEKIKAGLAGIGHVEIYVYDADHGFNCDQRPSYDRKSAMLAFGRSMILLNKCLS